MIVYLNGEEREVDPAASVSSLLAELAVARQQRGVALAVNAAVVPKSEWDTTTLQPGDRVEILVAVQGG
jgi:sulfur carrier protein